MHLTSLSPLDIGKHYSSSNNILDFLNRQQEDLFSLVYLNVSIYFSHKYSCIKENLQCINPPEHCYLNILLSCFEKIIFGKIPLPTLLFFLPQTQQFMGRLHIIDG